MPEYQRRQVEVLSSRLHEPPDRLIAVFGPRQSGKTTAVRQALQTVPHEHRFIAIDQPQTDESSTATRPLRLSDHPPGARSRTRRDIEWLVAVWSAARKSAWESNSGFVLVLDEIQTIKDWSAAVKGLWDADRADDCPMHVVIMGSAPLLMQSGLNESLLGRFETIKFNHWAYPEMSEAFGYSLDQYIYFGGYPGAAARIHDPQRWTAYVKESLIEPNIERDVLSMTRVDKPALLRRLFELGALFSGQVLSYNKMLGQLQDAGNTTTLARYLVLLSSAGLLTGLENYSIRRVSARASTPKLNVLNTALMAAATGYSFDEACADRSLWGRVVESAVGAHLVNTASPMTSVNYWRQAPFEVDFVLSRGPHTVAIEVKSGKAPANLRGLTEFEHRFRPQRSIVVGESDIPLAEFLSYPADHWIDIS
ncbi:MAG: AAA family ATPase [Acidimicrobiaceae bacterium]|nr:AAA family ATPase [Acidimicrobiaceae bacterium]MCY4280456.1 AAA family ATPase [Acidimicrobiaceae bacterium]MCY4295223.1 AAA family ATPase [Acidimicrobiaceae bacterium]